MKRRSVVLLSIGVVLVSGCYLPRWPVAGPLTSPFGIRFQGLSPDLHKGVDIRIPDGTEVRAMAPGRIRFAGTMTGYGQVIWTDHSGGVMSVYAHLSAIRVQAGEEISGGHVIGLSGHSGNASGPHLHFEIWRHGREVDPVGFLGGFPSVNPGGDPAVKPGVKPGVKPSVKPSVEPSGHP